MTQRKPLTIKQAKFVKAKLEGKSGTQAALEAYDTTPKVARTIAAENMAKPNIREILQAEFAKQGITLEAIVKPIADGLKADKVVIVGKDEDAFADLQPDHSIRLKASGMAAQFMGIGKNQTEVNVNFIAHAQEQRDIYDL